jgi:hypothetical protein
MEQHNNSVLPRDGASTATTAGPEAGLRSLGSGDTSAWRTVLTAWLTARLIVLTSFAVAAYLHSQTHDPKRYEGLLGWDADWYRRIAEYGYGSLPHEAVRFFPVLPLLARVGASLPAVTAGAALLVIANVASIGYALLLHRLALREGLSATAARRSVWVLTFSPAAFTLVMGYAEPLAGMLAVGAALLVRKRRWWLSIAPALLLGALRPTGVLIGIFILVEAVTGLRAAPPAERLARAAAVLSPAVGLGSYLAWCGLRFGQPLLPFTVQTAQKLRGGALVNPVPAGRAALHGLFDGRIPTQAPHLGWILLTLVLVAASARLLPASYAALAATVVVLGITARDFQSYERYAASAFPLLLVAARARLSPSAVTAAAVAAGSVLSLYTILAALHLYVP